MRERIISGIAKMLDINPADINDNSNFVFDLGADSLDLVSMLIELEEATGLEISDEDAYELETVGDVLKYIERALGNK